MTNFDHIFFMQQQQKRMENWERGQNILNRQLFNRATQSGLIKVDNGHVSVINLNETVYHFRYHPDIVTPLLSQALNRMDKELLERALTELYQKIF